MKFYRPDWHTFTHILGSFFLVALFLKFGCSTWNAIFFAFALGIVWEALDEFTRNVELEWIRKIFDPRGGDIGDLIADAIGILLAYFIVIKLIGECFVCGN